MAIPQEILTETGHVLAWMSEDGIRLHWVVGQLSPALQRWENYDEALVRTWAETGAPDDAIMVNEADLPEKAARSTAIIRDGRVVAAAAWRVSQWQAKVNAALDRADKLGGPRAMREALAATAPRLAHIERWATELRALTWDGEGDEPAIPELGPFSEPRNFPVNMTEKLSAYDEVGGVPEDLAQLVTGDETLAQAVERMTPGIDELLDMAQALSNVSLEKAVATIDPERSNDWMERIFAEKARLRLKRGTEEENLDRENLLNRTAAVFGKVGAKR